MMKLINCVLTLVFICSCATKGTSEQELIKQASSEHSCPPSEISVVNKRQANGGATYLLSVCGRQVYYYLVNGTFTEASKYKKPALTTQPSTQPAPEPVIE